MIFKVVIRPTDLPGEKWVEFIIGKKYPNSEQRKAVKADKQVLAWPSSQKLQTHSGVRAQVYELFLLTQIWSCTFEKWPEKGRIF